jgi:hypothetical protein
MPDLHLVKPEQLTDKDMFYESVKEIVELGIIINKRAGDSFLGEYLESRKLNNARQHICYVQYAINKLGEDKFKIFLDGVICLPLYRQRHTPNVLNEASNYYIELTGKIIQCPNFSKLENGK